MLLCCRSLTKLTWQLQHISSSRTVLDIQKLVSQWSSVNRIHLAGLLGDSVQGVRLNDSCSVEIDFLIQHSSSLERVMYSSKFKIWLLSPMLL